MSQPLSAGALILILLFALLLSSGCRVVGGGGGTKEESVREPAGTMRVYVGTYTGKSGSKGIYLFDFDLASGALKEVGVAAETTSPSFLALSPDNRHVYAVGEIEEFQGQKAGAVSAFAVDRATGTLTLLNQQPSGGKGPCHVSVDGKGKYVFVANYSGGNIASFPVSGDGKLGQAASVVQHTGKGTDPGRQEGPHAHGIWPSPDNRFVLACDLGLDKVLVYRLDAASGKLAANDPPAGDVPPGGGARHAAFSPDGKHLYCINEMGNTVTTFEWNARSGTLEPVQTIGTLPEGFDGKSYTAEIVVHPSGRFVYGSNRGHDSIAVFAAERSSGELSLTAVTPMGGKWPRNFNVDPSGRWLIAAGERSNTLTVFRIDQSNGTLTPVGGPVTCPQPACVIFTPVPR